MRQFLQQEASRKNDVFARPAPFLLAQGTMGSQNYFLNSTSRPHREVNRIAELLSDIDKVAVIEMGIP